MSIIETPIAPAAVPYLNKKYTISCKILDKRSEIPNLQAQLKYPAEINKFIKISSIRIMRDFEMETEIKKENKKKIVKEKIENITVYNINYDYELKQTTDLVFKPQIIITDGKDTQVLTPDIPVCFFNIKTQEVNN